MLSEVDKEKKEQEKKMQALMKSCFSTPQGEAVLAFLVSKNFGMQTTFSESPQRLAFNEGQRCVILEILSFMNKDIDSYFKQHEIGE